MRHAFSAEPRQPLGSAISGNDAQFHFRLPEFRGPARQPNGARQRQFATASQRETVNRGN